MSIEQQHNKKAYLADAGLLCVALCWGGAFVAAKFALTGMTPLNTLVYRYYGSSLLIFFCCLKKLPHLRNKKLLFYGTLCGINMFIGNSLQTIGLQYTTAGKQSFITALYILLVPLMSWAIFRKRPANHILIAAVIGFLGIALITLTDQFTIGKGDLLTFGLTLTFSAQMIFTSIVVKNIDPMVFTLVQLVVNGTLSLIAAFIFETPVTPLSLLHLPMASILGLLYLIVFSSALAFLLQNICLKLAPANHAAILFSLETVFGTIFAVCIAGEIFSGRMIIGCALMFLAIGITEYSTWKSSRELPA